VNEEIHLSPLRVIDEKGNQLGIMEREEAQRLANEAELDLVEVAPDSRPPVCRIMDYGKYKYEQSKREGKGKNHTMHLKEIRIRPKIQPHDLDTKIHKARQFLEHGDKVLVNMLFRGREMAHKDLAAASMNIFVEQLQDVAKVEQPATMVSRRMTLVLTPKK